MAVLRERAREAGVSVRSSVCPGRFAFALILS